MQCSKCPVCCSTPKEPINLKCQHHPCYSCATSIMTIDQENNMQTKYRITCPACKKKTLTYDVRHLIVSLTQQDQDLYCTTKYISKKAEVIVNKTNNYVQDSYSSKRNSLHSRMNSSVNNNKTVKIECKRHTNNMIQYYCQTCSKQDLQEVFFCSKCADSHKHKLFNINQAKSTLSQINSVKATKMLPNCKLQLNGLVKQLGTRKQYLKNEYEKLEKDITQQFKTVYISINKQYQCLKNDMKEMYTEQAQNIKNLLSLANRLKQNLYGLETMCKIDNPDLENMVNFHNYFGEIKRTIDNNKQIMNRQIETPSLIKKSIINFSLEPLLEIKMNNSKHSRKSSKVTSPVCSPRIQDYNSEGQKMKKIKMDSNYKGKQNITGVSPRQKYSFQSLLFHS